MANEIISKLELPEPIPEEVMAELKAKAEDEMLRQPVKEGGACESWKNRKKRVDNMEKETLRAVLEQSGFRDGLELLGYGLCDVCLKIREIGHGDKIYYDEKKGIYECRECEKEKTKE